METIEENQNLESETSPSESLSKFEGIDIDEIKNHPDYAKLERSIKSSQFSEVKGRIIKKLGVSSEDEARELIAMSKKMIEKQDPLVDDTEGAPPKESSKSDDSDRRIKKLESQYETEKKLRQDIEMKYKTKIISNEIESAFIKNSGDKDMIDYAKKILLMDNSFVIDDTGSVLTEEGFTPDEAVSQFLEKMPKFKDSATPKSGPRIKGQHPVSPSKGLNDIVPKLFGG